MFNTTKRLIINIRGTNGSGKSTAVKQLYESDETKEIVYHGIKKNGEPGNPCITILHKYNIILLGLYKVNTGGLDTNAYSGVQQTVDHIKQVVEDYPTYHIIYEGMMASSSIGTFYVPLAQYFNGLPNTTMVVVIMLPPKDILAERLYKRSGNQDLNIEAILRFWETQRKSVQKFKDAGVLTIPLDNSVVDKDGMLKLLVDTINTNII